MLKRILASTLMVALASFSFVAAKADKKNPVALIFKGKDGKKTTYYRSDVKAFKNSMPEDIRNAPDESTYDKIVDQIILDHVFTEESQASDLDNDPEVLAEMKAVAKEVKKKIWLRRRLNKMVKDEDLVKSYNKIKDSVQGKKVYNTAVIVVDDDDKAKTVLKEAQSGKDFGELAKKYSIENGTRDHGGEIGFLQEEHLSRMIEGDAAKKVKVLKDGVCSNRIFHTRDGKSVVLKRLAVKDAEVPEYTKIVPQLKALEMQKAVGILAKDLVKKQKKNIEAHDYYGNLTEPLKEVMAAPAA